MISIIIPTLNEEEGIAKVLCSVPEQIREKAEIIVVDVSTDYTPVIAERLGAKVIKAKERGKGRQMRIAVEQSQGDTLVFLDGDGTDPPEYIPQLLKELERADLVLGSRVMKSLNTNELGFRKYFSFYKILSFVHLSVVRFAFHLIDFKTKGDPLSGFRAIRRETWHRLKLESNDFEIETEMNIKAMKLGFVIKEVATPRLKRMGGEAKSKLIFNVGMQLKIAKILLKHFKDKKLRPRIKY